MKKLGEILIADIKKLIIKYDANSNLLKLK